uniref:Cyclic nucleotide-binding domain-containing protein n=1 Tax=Zooxanthella nutricula TaxID=1333877 RepID=A0A7S2JV51_9DINO
MLGLIAFSTIISSITTRMTQIRSMSQARDKQDYDIKAFFVQNSVSLELRFAVLNCIRANRRKKTRMNYASIDAVCNLPVHLKVRLMKEVFFPTISEHPLIAALIQVDTAFALDLLDEALGDCVLHTGEMLFNTGDDAGGMYVAVSEHRGSKAPLLQYKRCADR